MDHESSDIDTVSALRRVFQQQTQTLNDVSLRLGSTAARLIDELTVLRGKLVVTGVGKSGLIGRKIAATFASTGTSAFFVNASEALHGDLGMVSSGDAVLMISNSGCTPELIRMVPSLRHYGVSIYGIFGNVDTVLAEECQIVLDSSVEHEACHLGLAPTCSSTAALVLGDALACVLMQKKGFTADDFGINHPGGAIGRRLLLKAKDIMHTGEKLPVVKPTALLRDAAIEMTRFPLGAVCVCDSGNRLLGILTDGDFRRRLIQSDDLSITVKDCMTASPACASPDDTLDRLLKLMESPGRQVYSLPIVNEENRLVGFVRMHDILSGNK